MQSHLAHSMFKNIKRAQLQHCIESTPSEGYELQTLGCVSIVQRAFRTSSEVTSELAWSDPRIIMQGRGGLVEESRHYVRRSDL